MTPESGHPMDTGFKGNRYGELGHRREDLGAQTVSPMLMAETGEWLTGHGKTHMYLTHPAVDVKLAYLDSVNAKIAQEMGTEVPARMLKTVTLKFTSGENTYRVLVGSVGRRIDKAEKRTIAADLKKSFQIDLTPKEAKGGAINPPDGWDPADALHLEPGVVGPLLADVRRDEVLAYYFLGEKFDPDGPPVPVELALSPKDSLVMLYPDLLEMLPDAQAVGVGKPEFFRVIPEPEPDPKAGGELST